MRLLPCIAGLLALSCGKDGPAPCTQCLDVAGSYQLTRTVSSTKDCPLPPEGGKLTVAIEQTGSRVTLDYDGTRLTGTLMDDQSVNASSDTTRTDSAGSWSLKQTLEGSFSSEGGSVALTAHLNETREPTSASTNRGKTCTLSVALSGGR